MENNFEKILIANDEINKKIKEIANEINKEYKDKKDVLIIPILDGSIVFAGQIIPLLDFDLILKSTRVSLYENNTFVDRNKLTNIKIDFDKSLIVDKDIIIIEDLIDTGNTLNLLKNYLLENKARSVKICILFKKEIDPREIEIDIDWFCFSVPNEWIAGFGVDSKSKFRNFKHLGIVKKELQ